MTPPCELREVLIGFQYSTRQKPLREQFYSTLLDLVKFALSYSMSAHIHFGIYTFQVSFQEPRFQTRSYFLTEGLDNKHERLT